MRDASENAELLHETLGMLRSDGPVSIGTMFRRPAIRAGGKIVAFLGFDQELIVKVPEQRAQELVTEGVASPVTMRDRTMREWIHIPTGYDDESTLDAWLPYAQEALEYVQSLQSQQHFDNR